MDNKVLSFDRILETVHRARKNSRKVVTTNGCFDILHLGHLTYLNEAKKLGDLLIVGVNSDASIRELKGKNRPVNAENVRAAMVAGLASVDYVFIFNEKDPITFIKKLKPDVHVKGGDYTGKILEQEAVEMHGGQVKLVKAVPGISTTHIIKKILTIQGTKNK
jgi:glycerol-3-phosphate cytidylyltransferase